MKGIQYRLVVVMLLLLGHTSAAPLAFGQDRQLTLVVTAMVGGTTDQFARRWAATVRNANSGINVVVRNNSTWRGVRQIQKGLQFAADVIVSRNLPAVGLEESSLPFTFRSREALATFAATRLANRQVEFAKILAFVPTGVKVMVGREPINSPDDFNGLTLVDTGGLGDATVRALRNKAVPVYTKSYRAIVSEGFPENTIYSVPLLRIPEALFRENRVISMTNHQFAGIWIGIRKAVFASLTDQQMRAINTATNTATSDVNWRITDRINRLREDGVTIHTPSALDSLYAAFSPDESNTNGCTNSEYKAEIDNACKCVQGNKPDEC